MDDAASPGHPPDPERPSEPGPERPPEPGDQADYDWSKPHPLLGAGAAAFLTLGLTVAVSLAVGAGIGYLIDSLAHTEPIFTLIGLAFGVAVAVVTTVSTIRRYL